MMVKLIVDLVRNPHYHENFGVRFLIYNSIILANFKSRAKF
jgi:hypothetical protein